MLINKNASYISTFFMHSSGEPELCTIRGCRRYEAQGMKLWYFTANPLQQSRCGKIDSLEEEKVPLIKLIFVFMNTTAAIFMHSSGETFPLKEGK